MYRFRAFKAATSYDICQKYIEGHVNVLKDYGVTNITTNSADWVHWDCIYGIVAEKEDGTIVGGIRIQISDGIHPLPIEKAIGKMDPTIHDIVNEYRSQGVGELCALWNAKEVAGMGLSILLTRAGISMVNQVKCNILLGICAEYTLKMFSKVGFVVDNSLGNHGEFAYPNENYVSRVLGILNAKNLSTAEEYDRLRMLDLRNKPIQRFTETGPGGIALEVEYLLSLLQTSQI